MFARVYEPSTPTIYVSGATLCCAYPWCVSAQTPRIRITKASLCSGGTKIAPSAFALRLLSIASRANCSTDCECIYTINHARIPQYDMRICGEKRTVMPGRIPPRTSLLSDRYDSSFCTSYKKQSAHYLVFQASQPTRAANTNSLLTFLPHKSRANTHTHSSSRFRLTLHTFFCSFSMVATLSSNSSSRFCFISRLSGTAVGLDVC
jgi:hypothetical protein